MVRQSPIDALRVTSYSVAVTVLLLCGAPAAAQQEQFSDSRGLRRKLVELFIFGQETTPLGLRRDSLPNDPLAIVDRGGHFTPSARANNGTLIEFIENAIGNNISNIPFSSTNNGFRVEFLDGNPVLTRQPPGPIFAERAQTLGAGRVLAATNFTVFKFKTVRGIGLDRLRLNFTHVNVDFAGCDSLVGGDCSSYGIPAFENEFMQVDLDLDLQVSTLSFVLAYGLLDRVDIGVAVPIVFTSLRGSSRAQVVPFGATGAAHFFEGTATDPQLLSDPRFVEGSASGIGDVAARLKVALTQSGSAQLGLIAEARFATGSEDDFLGAGEFAFRALGIAASSFAGFSPHANLGYLHRSGELQNDALLATLGFDQVLAPWATLALDVVSQFQLGTSTLELPNPVVVEAPFRRIIDATTVPDIRDDIIDGSVGFKFVTPSGVTLVLNSLWPLNRGGLRANVIFTTGLEYNF